MPVAVPDFHAVEHAEEGSDRNGDGVPVRVYTGIDWCSHAVQVALANDLVGALERDEGAIAPRDVITAREAVTRAVESLEMRRRSEGMCCADGGHVI